MLSQDELLQAIDDLGATPWSGTAFRHTAPNFPALSGSGAAQIGGRWNPQGVSTIYLATPEDACVAEFMRLAKGQANGAQSFLPRDLHELSVFDLQVLDLRSATAQRSVGIGLAAIEDPNRLACQTIGEAAQYLGFQGILAPSATRIGLVVAAFERQVRRGQLVLRSTRALASVLAAEQSD